MMRRIKIDYSCDYPTFYYIDPSTICNLHCKFCPTGTRTSNIETGMMSLENFKIIFKKINRYAKEIHLYNYGEPFLNKNLIEFISLSSEKGIKTVIHSNLNIRIFDENESLSIVKSGLSELSASIDGATQDTYEKYRIGGNIEKVFANIQMITQAKRKLKLKTPVIKWSFLINKINEHQISLAKQEAKAMDILIGFTLMEVWGDKEWESSYHSNLRKLAGLRRVAAIERILYGPGRKEKLSRILKASIDFVESKVNYRQGLPANADKIKLSSILPSCCSQPFNKMIVNWNGNVLPCCAVSDEKTAIGNLISDELNNVWNSVKMRKCRIYLLNADAKLNFDSVCESCGVSKLNGKQ